MTSTTDGFKIAEVDLQLRGPGNIQGTQQSGMLKFKIANLSQDEKIMYSARAAAMAVIKDDPLLNNRENFLLRKELDEKKHGTFWGNIS